LNLTLPFRCDASSTAGARSTSEEFGQVERGVEELLQCLAGQTAPIVSVTDYSATVDDNGL